MRGERGVEIALINGYRVVHGKWRLLLVHCFWRSNDTLLVIYRRFQQKGFAKCDSL